VCYRCLFPQGQSDRGVKLSNHLILMLRLMKQKDSFTLTFIFVYLSVLSSFRVFFQISLRFFLSVISYFLF
jgi:hypothetical protein